MKVGQSVRLQIRNLDHQLRGVADADGRTWFVRGALAGEQVRARVEQLRSGIGFAEALEIEQPSPDRQSAFCAHYGVCGGCSLQHLNPAAQVEAKQQAVLQQLQRLGGVTPKQIAPPLMADSQGYRRQARLALKPPKAVLGFRQAQSQEIVEIRECPVLSPALQRLLPILQDWLQASPRLTGLGHLDILAADTGVGVQVRHDGHWAAESKAQLLYLAERQGFSVFEQAGAEPPQRLCGPALAYRQQDLSLDCQPGDFLQVHAELNRQMLAQALAWLQPKPDESGLDLFAGLGNFSLPLARYCQQLTAVEVSAEMVQRLKANAARHQLANLHACRADLMQDDWWQLPWARNAYDWALLDPPRAGAEQLAKELKRLKLKRVLYVSCEPSTLARDLKWLTASGFRLQRFGVIDMFPHTAHIETMVLLVKT